MPRWTLTDAASNVWLEEFTANHHHTPLPAKYQWHIRKRSLHGGLSDGIDVVEIDNGPLSFAVLPTRGMGIWRGNYRGIPLGWQAPIRGPVHPKFVHESDFGGLGWLTGFDEWLCRCGLASNGPPGEDVFTDENGQTHKTNLTLHGRIANRPADRVEVLVEEEPPYYLRVRGQVEESGLFLPRLRLTTEYTTALGSNYIEIHDVVENLKSSPAEMQLLYHCNVGSPLLEPGSRVVAPVKEMSPLTTRAAEGIDQWQVYGPPTSGFSEQVYVFELLANTQGQTVAMLHNSNSEIGMAVRFRPEELPCFTVWKNTGALADGYVTGLEPATNYPNFKTFERKQGRVVRLAPGGRWEARWRIEVHDSREAVANVLAEISDLQNQQTAKIHKEPHVKFSAQAK